MFSRLQQMNISKMDPEKRNKMMKDARDHFTFSMAVYQLQMDNGMYFLHEHPWTATSWDEDFVKRLSERDEVMKVRGELCDEAEDDELQDFIRPIRERLGMSKDFPEGRAKMEAWAMGELEVPGSEELLEALHIFERKKLNTVDEE